MYLFAVLGAMAAIITVSSCKNEGDVAVKDDVPHGIILANMDTTVAAKDDFYNFVNGTWLKETEIPSDRSSWGGFSVLRKSTDADVLGLIAEAQESGKYGPETDQAKALAIFTSKLDTVARDAAGISPLQPTLDAIDGISDLSDLQTVLATYPAADAPLLSMQVFGDFNDSSMNTFYVSSSGAGLPDRDYYLLDDQKSQDIRNEYKKFITKMLQYVGDDEATAAAAADKILAMETQLVEPRLDKVESRDVRKLNNPMKLADLQAKLTTIDLQKLMTDMEVPTQIEDIILIDVDYIDALDDFLKNTSIEDIKTLVKWSTLNNAANMLTTEIETTNWEFYSKYLNKTEKQRPADERALSTVNNIVGEALGKLYVDAKFPPEAKASAEEMIDNVIAAFKGRVNNLEWMSDSTKIKAIEKLDKFTVKIGYPDEWEDYSELEVSADKGYFDNMLAVNKWAFKKNMEEVYQPVDRTEWGMAPQIVNAYFNPLNNEIVFPAAILQPPFYDYLADEAVNYGGMGAVIGHEISHAFDDSGARFDAEGNAVNWWTDADMEEFTKRVNQLAEQYDKIEVIDSVFINGKFTSGENIGDLGGLLGAYDGLQLFFEKNGRPDLIDGYTPEQRFFMSWATIWRTLAKDEALRNQVLTDPHSPGRYRATQPLLNIDAFYEAFDIKEGDGMWLAPEKRVRIW